MFRPMKRGFGTLPGGRVAKRDGGIPEERNDLSLPSRAGGNADTPELQPHRELNVVAA